MLNMLHAKPTFIHTVSSLILLMKDCTSVGLFNVYVFYVTKGFTEENIPCLSPGSTAADTYTSGLLLHLGGEVTLDSHLLVLVEDVFLRNSCLYHSCFLLEV